MRETRTEGPLATLMSIARYPVKSMIGEELATCDLTERGLLGDRAFALVDRSTGKVASAKNPKKWARLLEFRGAFTMEPRAGERPPAVVITTPDGGRLSSEDADCHSRLSAALGREVRLNRRESGHEGIVETAVPGHWTPKLEEYWPDDVAGLHHSGVVTDEAMPEGSFFDFAPIHVLTTATLRRLEQLYMVGQFHVHRFRPNLVIKSNGHTGFVEKDWIGRTIQIGNDVRMKIDGPCPRCVMTTLPQSGLPKDPGILRAAAQHNGANVGVYASVIQAGCVRTGDAVRVL
jgi:uncharacterized protein